LAANCCSTAPLAALPGRARRSPPASASCIRKRNLIPRFSVGENILLERFGRQACCGRSIMAAVHAEAKRWLDVLELDLDPRTPVARLNVAKMQLVEIAKALSLRSRVLLLDEPTASLTPHETVVLFGLLLRKIARRRRPRSSSSATSSRKWQSICDKVTVLRDGRNACDSRSMQGPRPPGPGGD